MAQRIQPLETEGFDEAKFIEKAKEIHKLIFRLEGEKYDLEKRYKEQQYDVSRFYLKLVYSVYLFKHVVYRWEYHMLRNFYILMLS